MGCGASTPENAVAPAPVKPAAVAPAPAPHQDRAPKVASTPPSAKAPASTASPVPPVASATSTPSPSKLRQPSALPLNKDDATKRLLQAAQSGDADRCQRALAADAQVSGTDDHGCTALHYAAGKSHLMVVNLLIKAGAPLEARDGEHCTPLLRAARDAEGPSGAEVVRRLIAAGAKAAAVDKAGNGLVHMAAQGANNASVLTALLEAKVRTTGRGD